ncbi:hypothetical protein NPIL_487851 [Nephila pilipes]|uniref:Uncharacterized protein n=1 Tax=Nephila pilipes TaxID=299642 RepID=A0A8X6NST5_NEPPI|nr:hypothetical protein NPIL_487851 [Nephila pilipes]
MWIKKTPQTQQKRLLAGRLFFFKTSAPNTFRDIFGATPCQITLASPSIMPSRMQVRNGFILSLQWGRGGGAKKPRGGRWKEKKEDKGGPENSFGGRVHWGYIHLFDVISGCRVLVLRHLSVRLVSGICGAKVDRRWWS